MKIKLYILIILSTFIYPDDECDIMIEDIKDFIIEQRNNNDRSIVPSKTDYIDFTDTYNSHLDSIDNNNDCSSLKKDSIKINLKYYYGIFTVKRVGDVTSFKKMMSSSKKIIEKINDKLKNFTLNDYNPNDPADNYLDDLDILIQVDKVEAIQKASKLYSYYSKFNRDKINYEIENLDKYYKDLKIFIKDQKYLEMQQFYDKDDNESKQIFINVEPPPIYYKKSKFKNKYPDQFTRMNFLKSQPFPLKLTNYNEKNGFYMTIPMLPIVQEDWISDPEHAYTITINNKKKIRFEFNLVKQDDVVLNKKELNMEPIEDVPYNWSKIFLSSKYSWKFRDERDDFVIAKYDPSNGIIQNSHINEFIAIKHSDKFVIYVKKNAEKESYSIELDDKKSTFPSFLKYILFLILFGAGNAQT